MARDFDGTDDNINFGSDASIDDLSPRSICLWIRRDGSLQRSSIVAKSLSNAAWDLVMGVSNNNPSITQDFDTANGGWRMTSSISGGAIAHIAVTYDPSSPSNDPVFYFNGALDTTVETAAPSGTAQSDATKDLILGTNDALGFDFDGLMGWLVVASGILDAAAINRAKWWGRPNGGLQVYHPLVTDKLSNEGSATANGTASGTTVVGMAVPVVRPGTALMGMGVGW